jgi:broad specificity phosphatase PhoE
MARALFLRHGESAHNTHAGPELLADEAGDGLTERGRRQAADAGEALRERAVTRLLTSPMQRARETADAVGAALGIEPEPLDYSGELVLGEPFGDAVTRVRRLRAQLDNGEWGTLPLIVSHGIFIRFFLLDSVLGDGFTPAVGAGIWRLGSTNCGLSTFSRGEVRNPTGAEVPGWTCLSWMERPWDPH